MIPLPLSQFLLLRLLFLGTLPLFASPALLEVPVDTPSVRERCIEAFEEFYYSEDYTPGGWCHRNVKKLIEYFREKHIPFDPSRARVHYIHWPKERPKLKAWNTRVGTSSWNYHVVLEYDGEIFDLDFTDQPRVEKKAQYIQEMFLDAKPDLVANLLGMFSPEMRQRKIELDLNKFLDTVRVRSMPAVDYIREGADRADYDNGEPGSLFFYFDDEGIYDTRTLREFVWETDPS